MNIMKIPEKTYLKWMNDYFHSADDKEENNYQIWKDFLIESKNTNTLFSVWNSMIEGRLGMHVRNYMREQHPEIDEDDRFKNEDGIFDYGKVEDYSWELIEKLVDKMEKGEIN